MQERDRENAGKPHTPVIEERRALDESYKHIVDVVNANLLLGQLAGETAENFVNTVNETIHRYAMLRHKSRHGGHGGHGHNAPDGGGETES